MRSRGFLVRLEWMRSSVSIALSVLALLAGAGIWLRVHTRSGGVNASSVGRGGGVLELPSNPTAGPLWDSAVAIAQSGDHETAARLFGKGEALSPRDAAWPQAAAECWAAAGLHDSALGALERCQFIAGLSARALVLRRSSRLEQGFAMASTGQPWKGRQLGEAILLESPNDSEATLLVGYSQAMNGNPGSAETLLADLVRDHPGMVQAYPILVQCAFRRGDAVAAERWIGEIANRDQGSVGLGALRQQLQILRERGVGASNKRLRIICQGQCPYGLESEVLESAESAWNFLKAQIGTEPNDPVNILLGGSANAPYWAAASFDGQVHLPLDPASDPSRRDAILRHELTHAFMAWAGAGNVPLWLNEGLAQYYQGARCDRLPDAATESWLDSLESRRTFVDLDEDQAELAYTFSLAVAQELMELHTSTSLTNYLGMLRSGLEENVAFAKAFGDDYAHLSARIRARL
jgi:hypothetical protein